MTGKGVKLTALSLSRLSTATSLNSQSSIFRGIISNLQRYDSKTRSLYFRLDGIEEDKGSVEIEVRGEVGEDLSRKLKEGNQIILKGRGGTLVLPRNDQDRSKVVYERVISGYYLPGEVSFEISQDAIKKVKKAKEPVVDSNKITTPDAKSTFRLPLKTMNENQRKKDKVIKMKDKAVQTLPGRFIPNPSSELVDPTSVSRPKKRTAHVLDIDGDGDQEMEYAPRTSREIKIKKVSAPGEGSRSIKRRKQEEKLIWDLKLIDGTVYSTLKDVQAGVVKGSKNFMVVIVGITKFSPREASGDQWYVRLRVTDPTLPNESPAPDASTPTIEVQWYENDEKKIPKFQERDILIARSLFVPTGRIKIVRSSKFSNPYRLLKPSELLDPAVSPFLVSMPFKDSPTIVLSQAELDLAVQLAKFYKKRTLKITQVQDESQTHDASISNSTTQRPIAAIQPAQPGRLRQIKDIEPGVFCDVYGEILKCHIEDFVLPSSHPVNLYITDYTSNPLLMSYDSTSSLPPGQQTLQISLFENQSEPLKPLLERSSNGWMEVRVGDFVRIDNIRVKENESGLLEATLVDDRKYEEKRYLRVIRKDGYLPKEVQELLKRKREQMKQNK